MNVSSLGHRIAPGWYRTADQLVLTLWTGRDFERTLVREWIIPKCRFRVRPVDGLGRDAWYEIRAYEGQASYDPEPGGRPGPKTHFQRPRWRTD